MDMSKYTGIFLEESKEHLQNLNDKLLELEADQTATNVLDEIFRSAHTLKGMSATMGYENLAELTHQMENVLSKLRAGEININTGIIDILFKCLDQLEKMMDDVSSGGPGKYQDSEILKLLNLENQDQVPPKNERNKPISVEEEGQKVDLNEFESNLIIEGHKKGFNAYHITIYIRPNCIMKAARAYMIFNNLGKIGEIVKTIPTVQDIEDENFENSFEILLISKETTEKIKKAIVSISEIDEPEIEQIEVQNATENNDQREQKNEKKEVKEKKVEIKYDDKKCEMIVPPHKPKPSQTVRVEIGRLDKLMNLVGELVINKTRLEQIAKSNPNQDLNEALEQTNRLTSDLQNIVMKVRMVPIEQIFNRFPRMVRDLAHNLDKEINFILEGLETELDRTVIDEIGDPLVHILRNSVDHGIESPEERKAKGKPEKGTIKLIARTEGNNVIIEVDDDGNGIDADIIRKKLIEKNILNEEEAEQLDDKEAINYIFNAGFSTASAVTDVSGRGVGLDVVRTKIESLSGEIYIDSKVGQYTKFIIHLPLTLAIIQALLVQVSEEIYSIPLNFIVETTAITPEEIKLVQDQEVSLLRGAALPLLRLRNIYQVPEESTEQSDIPIVVVKKNDKMVGLIVDNLIGQQEIVIKSLGGILQNIPAIAGATIMGNGLVSLIVDVSSLY